MSPSLLSMDSNAVMWVPISRVAFHTQFVCIWPLAWRRAFQKGWEWMCPAARSQDCEKYDSRVVSKLILLKRASRLSFCLNVKLSWMVFFLESEWFFSHGHHYWVLAFTFFENSKPWMWFTTLPVDLHLKHLCKHVQVYFFSCCSNFEFEITCAVKDVLIMFLV